ncbi:MAG TPA: sigma-70 family RNA polymerase sigma factor [Anaeromyxobacter sp.]
MTLAKRMDDSSDKGQRTKLQLVSGGRDARAARSGAGEPVDEALLAAFLVGDDEAFGELVRRNERLVLSIVRRYTRAPEDARDLAQRTFLRAFTAARRALGKDPQGAIPFRRWLTRIAVNLAKNHLRNERRFDRAGLELLGPADVPPVGADGLLRAERTARLRAEVLMLPRRQREVVTLRIDAELPFAEIAEVLGITENAAKVTFHHGSRRLREALRREEGP